MAVRIRRAGRIFCAAHTKAEPGDCYIDDPLHYHLSVERGVLVTDDKHFEHGQWWWKGQEQERRQGDV